MHGDSFIENQKYPMKPSSTSSCKRSIGNMALTSLLISELSKSPCVTISISEGVGRCADYVLKDIPGVTNVFIHAEIDDRIKRSIEVYGDDSEKIEHVINTYDKARQNYYNYHTCQKWGEYKNYNLAINSSYITEEEAAMLIKNYVERRSYR